MASETDHAREAFLAACLVIGLGYHADAVARVVLEDSLAALQDRLEGLEDRLADLARAWLREPCPRTRDDLRIVAQQKYRDRMVAAHDRLRRSAGAAA